MSTLRSIWRRLVRRPAPPAVTYAYFHDEKGVLHRRHPDGQVEYNYRNKWHAGLYASRAASA